MIDNVGCRSAQRQTGKNKRCEFNNPPRHTCYLKLLSAIARYRSNALMRLDFSVCLISIESENWNCTGMV